MTLLCLIMLDLNEYKHGESIDKGISKDQNFLEENDKVQIYHLKKAWQATQKKKKWKINYEKSSGSV